jgi:predicted nucleic acid-binding protein
MRMPPFGGGVFIADKSIWARSDHDRVREEWADAIEARQIATCHITVLELLYSARSQADLEALEEELSVLRNIPVTASAYFAALQAMRELAAVSDGFHRIPLPDYLIAACAQDTGLGVLHYDAHFDRLTQVIAFESRWAAPRGDLD